MNFSALFSFFGKVILAEVLIEALRFGIYAMWNNLLPTSLLLTHSNRYFSIILNVVETLAVIALFYRGFNLPTVVISVLIVTFVVKYLGNQIFRFLH